MLTDSSASSLVSRCADEYLERLRRGERPTVAEYSQRYPHLADRLREYLPLVSMLEEVGAGSPRMFADPSRLTMRNSFPERLGDYRLLREIGRGGMGIIFEAEQLSLGRRVAIKLLTAPRALDATSRARFQREARVASRLHHTNIVPVFEVGQAEGWWFYSMQFITGHPLDAVLKELRRRRAIPESSLGSATEESSSASRSSSREDSATADSRKSLGEREGVGSPTESASDIERCREADALPLASVVMTSDATSDSLLDSLVQRLRGGDDYFRRVAELLAQAAEALAFAHQQGVVHRDIKPANLLIDDQGRLWVADFGLARATDLSLEDELTRTGDFVGTMKYMAPEQFHGRSDERSDLYSLGLVLYEALTLRSAFESSARWRLLRTDSECLIASPSSIDPSIPRDLVTLCEKCVETDPTRRIESAQELADELRRFLRGEPIRSRPIAWWSKVARWCRRNPLVASLSAALLLAMVAGTAIAVWQAARFRSVAKSAQDGWDNADANATRAIKLAEAERTARENLDHNLYVAHMNLVQEAVESGNAGQGRRRLEQHRPRDGQPDRRGFEWHYWQRVLNRDEGSFEPFGAPLRACSLSPSSRLLAMSGEAAGTEVNDANSAEVQLCDTNTRQTLRRWPARTPQVVSLAFFGDGLLIGGSARGEIIIWNVPDGTELRRWSAHRTGVAALRIATKSKSLVTASADGAVACWSLSNELTATDSKSSQSKPPKPSWTWSGAARVNAIDVSPDEELLAGASFDQTVWLWEMSSGRVLREFREHAREVFAVAFAPSESAERPADWTLLSGGNDRTIRAWNARTGEPLWTRETTTEIESLVVSGTALAAGRTEMLEASALPLTNATTPRANHKHQDGAAQPQWVLCATNDWQVTPWPLDRAAAPRAALVGHSGPVRHLLVSNSQEASGDWFVSASIDGTARRWSFDEATRPDALIGHRDQIQCLSLSHDQRQLLTASRDRQLWKWDLQTRRGQLFVDDLPNSALSIAHSPVDDRVALSVGNSVWLLDATGQKIQELSGSARRTRAIAWHPQGRPLAVSGQDPIIRVWDSTSGMKSQELSGHTREVRKLTYSHDGRRLASVSDDRTLRIWPLNTEQTEFSHAPIVAIGHSGVVHDVAWSHDDQTLWTCSADGTIREWRSSDGLPLRTIGGSSGPLFNLLLSHDERTLFVTGHDKLVRLLDLATGQQKTTLKGHTQRVSCLLQSRSDHTLITGSHDQQIRLWAAGE